MINPLISIIVPIYKVEKYLDKCITSIINQTYTNLEIILVDDGSPDNCGKICDDFAKKDSRIEVIHKANGGQSDARNAGIATATGEYIGFVDGDDYIHSRMYELLFDMIKEYDVEISMCTHEEVFINSIITDKKVSIDNVEILSPTSAIEKLLLKVSKGGTGSACNKLYKTDLFKDNSILFPVGRIHEDTFTACQLYYNAHSIAFSNVALYYYIRREDSTTGVDVNENSLDSLLTSKEMHSFVIEKKLPLIEQCEIYYAITNIELINRIIMHKSEKTNAEYLRQFRHNIIDNKNILNNRYLSSKHRVGVLLLILGCPAYIIVTKIYFAFSRFKNSFSKNS